MQSRARDFVAVEALPTCLERSDNKFGYLAEGVADDRES